MRGCRLMLVLSLLAVVPGPSWAAGDGQQRAVGGRIDGPATAAAEPAGADVDDQVAAVMNDLRMVLGTVGNEASAEAARPRLDQLRARLDALDPRIEQLSPADRAEIANLVDRGMAVIRGLAERVLALRGADQLRLSIEPIVARLNGWARRQA